MSHYATHTPPLHTYLPPKGVLRCREMHQGEMQGGAWQGSSYKEGLVVVTFVLNINEALPKQG